MTRQHPGLAEVFEDAAATRAFPGGVVWLARDQEVLAHAAFGTTAYDSEYSRPVSTDTIYDIASLSKLFTATAVLIAAREHGINLDATVARFLPQFGRGDKGAITVRQLLDHSSGIEIAVQALIHQPTTAWVGHIAAAPLQAVPGQSVLYSCTNYFLLGRLVEQWSSTSLNGFIGERILEPLQTRRTVFRPLEHFAPEEIAPTELNADGGRPSHGVVHDEAARTWEAENGSACGNAGLFSVASDVARFGLLWLQEGASGNRQIIAAEDVRRAFSQTVRARTYDQGLGWHLNVASWMSEQAPPGAGGHTGFTGPTMFIVPPTRQMCIILNNRVYPTRNGPNRMPLHSRIAQWLFAQDAHEGLHQ